MDTDNEEGEESVLDSDDWPDTETSHKLMKTVLSEYLKRHKVVLKKLGHAQQATIDSLKEIDSICERFELDEDSEEIENIHKYDELWGSIIDVYSQKGMTEEEISQIDDALTRIPRAIKTYYEALIQKDKALQEMMSELGLEEYQRARKLIKELQSRTNPFTGLGPEEYEGEDADEDSIFEGRAFKILTNMSKDKDTLQ